ncbi:nitroreductase [Rhizomicrobium palustre]|uniref:Putative NAD(P)H nitroreductase n=1 Tax=Rhizomicrobium palustre TaxID=189966 RepID=A0A846N2A8_9PROT|nr:nitroreductase [Rhizomicrobium palustre]NIK90124.1 nitroreductase [Rhizomicrobium palustre]
MDSPPPFNVSAPKALDLLLTRRSGSAKAMTGPGPGPEELDAILKASARVPDHGKLAPWRFVVFEGDARARFGQLIADALAETEKVSDERSASEAARLMRAPVVVAVISRVREAIPIPEWEQVLSAGAVCQNMLIAAHALGYVGNWLTEWYAYHPVVKERMGLKPGERIAGFIYIGTSAIELEERIRPDLEKIVTRF